MPDLVEEEEEVLEVEDCMLSTDDNPYDPFEQFDEWKAFDEQQGYHSCAYLARIVKSSDDLSDSMQEFAINAAINEIVRFNITGNYIKVTRDYFKQQVLFQ